MPPPARPAWAAPPALPAHLALAPCAKQPPLPLPLPPQDVPTEVLNATVAAFNKAFLRSEANANATDFWVACTEKELEVAAEGCVKVRLCAHQHLRPRAALVPHPALVPYASQPRRLGWAGSPRRSSCHPPLPPAAHAQEAGGKEVFALQVQLVCHHPGHNDSAAFAVELTMGADGTAEVRTACSAGAARAALPLGAPLQLASTCARAGKPARGAQRHAMHALPRCGLTGTVCRPTTCCP